MLGYVIVVGALVVSLLLGVRLGRVSPLRLNPDERAQLTSILASLLAIVGFILGFTFSIVQDRYAMRRALVVQEANAIGTTYLRTSFLPEPMKTESRELLRKYVALRVAVTMETLSAGLEESGKIHLELWKQAAAAGNAHPDWVMVSLYVDSLNTVIDLHTTRLGASVRMRLPRIFFFILRGSCLLAMVMLGYSLAQASTRKVVLALPLVLVLGALLELVADMDRTDLRLVKVGRAALEDVQKLLAVPPPTP